MDAFFLITVCGFVICGFVIVGIPALVRSIVADHANNPNWPLRDHRARKKDRRTLAEKDWDFIMGPKLPSTCASVGEHELVKDGEGHVCCYWCDYVGAETLLPSERPWGKTSI